MSCTGPSWRYEATRRRSRDDAAIAFPSSASRSSCPRWSLRVSDQTSGTWISTISPIAPRIRWSERREQTTRTRRDRAEALVDLEQHRRPRRRPDPRVRLDQPALTAVESVLGTAKVAHLHLRPTLTQETPLAGIERVAAADLGRVVRVEDAPVRRPDLHAHDRGAQHARDDDIVHGSQRIALTGEQTVTEGRFDELPRLLHFRPRLTLRLVDRDGAEREIPADHDHGDRGHAPEREAQEHRSCRRRGTSDSAALSRTQQSHRTHHRRSPATRGPTRTNVALPARPAGREAPSRHPSEEHRCSTSASSHSQSPSPSAGAALAVAPIASAKGGDGIRVRGVCTKSSTAKLKLSREDRRIEIEFEVDQNRNGVPWKVTLRRNGSLVASTIATTHAPSGSFSLRRVVSGTQATVVATATRSSGERCTARAAI